MAAHRKLSKPPIIEALADIRATVSQPQEAFEALATEFIGDYPQLRRVEPIRAEIKIEGGKLLPPKEERLGFQGITLTNSDQTLMVQFRLNGFTLNNLKEYVGGDRLHQETMRLWSRYEQRLKPTEVSRVAFRYINQLRLALPQGIDFGDYLTSTPELPPELPQSFSEFLSRVVSHPSDQRILIVTQRLMAPSTSDSDPPILIDIDVSENRVFGTAAEIEEAFRNLRNLRNQAFFALITEKTASLYV